MHLIIPKNYNPVLNLRDTEIAIKLVKDFFETELARALNLTRVSAPIMVTPGSGLNDNLYPLTFLKPAKRRKSSIRWRNGSVRRSKRTASSPVKDCTRT